MRVIKSVLASIFAGIVFAGIILANLALMLAAAHAADDVDLLLVLAADVSRSIDAAKFQLQRDGYAAAISDPRVIDTIRSGRDSRIGLTFVEWSGEISQHVVIDWTMVGDARIGQGFRRPIACRAALRSRTARQLAAAHRIRDDPAPVQAPFNSARHTIDISGDGTNNAGRDVAENARRRAAMAQERHHQRSRHPQRQPDVMESGAHQSARRPR